ncbi:hypothetical protein CN918_25845 [Priestia megaterium]|nr:hypothetical protein CN918_25845 [Priestia megaterium]
MFSLLFGVTFAVIALGGAVTAIELTMTKDKKRWLEKVRSAYSLKNAVYSIKTKPGKKPIYIYEDEFGTYTLAPQGHLWYITCKWRGANNPYLKYMYNPSNGAITHTKLYKDEVPLSISGSELKEGIHWMQTALHERIRYHSNPAYTNDSPQTSATTSENKVKKDKWDVLLAELQNGHYNIFQNQNNRFALNLFQNQIVTFKEDEEKETFEYAKVHYGKTYTKYSITRHKDTHEMYQYDVEDELLNDIEDIREFALKQERIWKEIKRIANLHHQKHKDLQNYFSSTCKEKEKSSVPSSYSFKPQDIQAYQTYFKKNIDYMHDEDIWYVTQILPKRLGEIQRFLQRHPETAGAFQKGLEQGLLKRLEEIYIRLQGNIEKEKIRLKKVVEIEG